MHKRVTCKQSGSILFVQDETEYETDSEDEVYGQQLLKPVFVPKADREVCWHQYNTYNCGFCSYCRGLVLSQQYLCCSKKNTALGVYVECVQCLMQTIAERERMEEERLAEQAREQERLKSRKVFHSYNMHCLCVTKWAQPSHFLLSDTHATCFTTHTPLQQVLCV